MSGFVATGPTPPEDAIESDGFWPAVSPSIIRAAMRLDGTVSPERQREALIAALSTINGQLADWQATQVAAGNTTLLRPGRLRHRRQRRGRARGPLRLRKARGGQQRVRRGRPTLLHRRRCSPRSTGRRRTSTRRTR